MSTELKNLRVYFLDGKASSVHGYVDVYGRLVCYEYRLDDGKSHLGYIPLSSIREVKEIL